jgi:NAD-dependent dihydropyrimidine dehydrogenase PreA subunit
MFELVVRDRCTGCNRCVEVCPTNVLEAGPDTVPVVARVEHCQTCFMCELYCEADAIYVGPDRERREPVTEAEVVASGHLGQFRRDSGWNEWAKDPTYDSQIWKLGPYIQAGMRQSIARVEKRLAERAQRSAPSPSGSPTPSLAPGPVKQGP